MDEGHMQEGAAMNPLFNISLLHPSSGERKSVPVVFVATNGAYVTIRWDMAGLYDLNLAVNVLTQRDAQAQTKGKAKWYKKQRPQWRAGDIPAVRKMVREYLDDRKGTPQREALASYARHVQSMQPNPRIETPNVRIRPHDPFIGGDEPRTEFDGKPDND
jgi:hypothetical protein